MKVSKRIFSALALVFLMPLVFAQNQTDEIELPDLTTVIEAQDEDEEIEIPEFADIVEMPESQSEIVPVLPDFEQRKTTAVSDGNTGALERLIYAEGQIGGGYPTNFIGDFMISRIYGDNPFKLGFSHDSIVGFAAHRLSDGFSKRNTLIYLDKLFSFNTMKLELSGEYEDSGNGLQSVVTDVAAFNQDNLLAKIDYSWALPHGFSIGASASGDLYFRFADLTSLAGTTVADWVRGASVFDFTPTLFAKWEYKNFSIGLNGKYLFEDDVSGKLGDQMVSRAQFGLDSGWKNDFVKVYGDVGIVLGNKIGDNSFIIPFTLGFDAAIPVYFSDRKLSFSLEGGFDSAYKTPYELEKAYAYSAFSFLPTETTDLFTHASFSVPLKTSFTGTAEVEYRKSFFGNGLWQPDYDSEFTNGIYSYTQYERDALATKLGITYRYKLFAISLLWNANWIDIPALEDGQSLALNMSLQNQTGKVGFSLDSAIALDSDDRIPEINFEGFVAVSPAVRLVLRTDDFIKLVSGTSRTYAGKYITTGGKVTLLVKFLF